MKRYKIVIKKEQWELTSEQWAPSEMQLRLLLCEVIHEPFEIISIEEIEDATA